MKRRNVQTVGEVIKDLLKDNSALREKILEIRIQRGWGEILGPMVLQYTRNLYIKNHVLYVSLTSSVLRSELLLSREKLLQNLNDYAGSPVIKDIVIR